MAATAGLVVCTDIQRRTCLQVLRLDASRMVHYLQFDPSCILAVRKMSMAEFDKRFSPMVDYPVKQCCSLYLGYAQMTGCTPDALGYLKQYVTVGKALEDELTTRPDVTATEPLGEGEAPKKRVLGARAPTGGGLKGSGAFICEKLLEGKLSHDKIVEAVLQAFPGRKTSVKDVKWNLAKLKREGKIQ